MHLHNYLLFLLLPLTSPYTPSFYSFPPHFPRLPYITSSPSSPPKPTKAPTVVFIHGFGSSKDHFRRLLDSATCTSHAIDLLGYGETPKIDPQILKAYPDLNPENDPDFLSDRDFPEPRKGRDVVSSSGAVYSNVGGTSYDNMQHPLGSAYNFHTWSRQVACFLEEVLPRGGKALLVCNSIGCSVGLQVALDSPSLVSGVVMLNPSLRMLNFKRMPGWKKVMVQSLQWTLRETWVGMYFFNRLARPAAIKSVLKIAYGGDDGAFVNDKLVDTILKPGLEVGARKVFLDFLSYSGGPLIEEQLAELSYKREKSGNASEELRVTPPVGIGWGTLDPWEPVEAMEVLKEDECVVRTRKFEGAGHCCMDEEGGGVGEFIKEFIDDFVA